MEWGKAEIVKTQQDMKTPYFLLDEQELERNIDSLQTALAAHWKNHIIGYSFKTNSLPWLVDYFKNKGCYAEVVSGDEYHLAQIMGYAKDKIIYNGPCKSRKTFLEAIENGCLVNIDARRELEWLWELADGNNKKYEVGLRINFDLEKYCPNETAMGAEGSRFGFCYENGELKKAIDYIGALKHIHIAGIHLHCGSSSRSLNIYRTIAGIAARVKRAYALDLKYVNVGGGFCGGLKDKPQFRDYIPVIADELSKEFDQENTTLVVEPGVSLVASPFEFVTSIIDVKKTTANNFAVTDGSRINVDPLMKKSTYFYDIIYAQDNEAERQLLDTQVIVGFTCMENDRLFELVGQPRLSVGDRVVYQKTGAYTLCLSPLFIRYYPAVYLRRGDNFYCLRSRLTAADYLHINANLGDK